MKTFLLVLAGILGLVVLLKCLPLFLVPIGASVGLVGLAALIVCGTVIGAIVGTLGLAVGILVALLVVTALLSPLWIPVLLICGLIALIKRIATKSA